MMYGNCEMVRSKETNTLKVKGSTVLRRPA